MSEKTVFDEDFNYAEELIADKKYEEAKTVLFNIINEEPSYGKAYNHLGWLFYTIENDLPKAEEFYQLAMKFAPDYPASFLNYAYMLNNQKRFSVIEAHLKKCDSIPGIAASSLAGEWAFYYEETRQYEKAIKYYKEQALSSYDLPLIEKIDDAIKRCEIKLAILRR